MTGSIALNLSPAQAGRMGLHLLKQAVRETFRDGEVHLLIQTSENNDEAE